MTPHSVQPVPDRCITRLRHTQSGTRGRRVKDLSLRAIQISCTLFHPLHCLSLALFSVWMSVLFFFFSDVSPVFLYTSSGAMIEPPPSLRYVSKNFPLNVCLHPTILNFMFLFPSLLSLFSLSTHVRWGIFSRERAP